ncbi:MAG TPA: DUF4190 domain-containing protein [Actinomycetota bacterium]|nr:DUF4190 domain-containing protein [Actinomycetota bacterium]
MATAETTPADLRPLRIGEILDVAIKIYTRFAFTLFRIVALVVVPVQAIGLFIIASTIPDSVAATGGNPFQIDPNTQVPTFTGRDIALVFAGNLLASLIAFVGTTLATGGCFKAVTDAYLGTTADWRSSLRYALGHLRSLLWVTFLAGLGAGLGLLFCIAPGVWLWASWSVAIPIVLTEGARGTRALGRSFNLVQNRWWSTFAVLLLAYMLAFVVSGAVGALVAIVNFSNVGQNVFLTQVFDTIAGTVGSVVVTPFQAAVVAVLYFDLRVRKEGFDLQLLAQRIGSTAESPHAALLPPASPLSGTYIQPSPAYEGGPPLPPAPAYQAQQTDGRAIAALVFGIVWLFWLGSIAALFFGYSAKRRIDASNGTVNGRGLATAGIVLGWIGMATLAIAVVAFLSLR